MHFLEASIYAIIYLDNKPTKVLLYKVKNLASLTKET